MRRDLEVRSPVRARDTESNALATLDDVHHGVEEFTVGNVNEGPRRRLRRWREGLVSACVDAERREQQEGEKGEAAEGVAAAWHGTSSSGCAQNASPRGNAEDASSCRLGSMQEMLGPGDDDHPG